MNNWQCGPTVNGSFLSNQLRATADLASGYEKLLIMIIEEVVPLRANIYDLNYPHAGFPLVRWKTKRARGKR